MGNFLTSCGATSSSGSPVLNGGSSTNHNGELLKPITLTFQFIQASVLCNKIPVLLGPVCSSVWCTAASNKNLSRKEEASLEILRRKFIL